MNRNKITIFYDIRKNLCCKAIAILLVLAFVNQDIVWAQAGEPLFQKAYTQGQSQPSGLKDISLPKDLAITRDRYDSGKEDLIINIQDAHASLGAQDSISKILGQLVSDYNLNIIAIEGTSGYIDTSVLHSCPDEAARRRLGESLVKEGKMSAGGFFSLVSEKPVALYGVDDETLYAQNAALFRKVYEINASLSKDLKSLKDTIFSLEDRVYSRELKDFISSSLLLENDSAAFAKRWEYMSGLAARLNIDHTSYKNLEILSRALGQEGKIDFEEANTERDSLIGLLTEKSSKETLEELVSKSIAFRSQNIPQADFYSYLLALSKKEGIGMDRYPELAKYTRYITTYESIDLISLFEEMAAFEDALGQKVFQDDDERRVYSLSRMARLMSDMLEMKLTPGSFGYLKDTIANIDKSELTDFVSAMASKYNARIDIGYDADRIISGIKEAAEFYLVAGKRDSAILENTIASMRQTGEHVAALITGGYHTEGLSKLLREKKASYMVILPKFDASGPERPYVAILTNKKEPYEGLLKTGEYHLALTEYCAGVNERAIESSLDRLSVAFTGLLDMKIRALRVSLRDPDKVRAEVISFIDEWVRKYEEECEATRHLRPNGFKPLSAEEFRARLVDVAGEILGESLRASSSGDEFTPTFLARQRAESEGVKFVKSDPEQLIPVVDWMITERCNRQCKVCWTGSSPAVTPNRLTFEEHKAVLDRMYQKGVRSIALTGGEPLLVSHLPELIKYCRNRYPDMQINLYTNGVLLEDLFDRIVPYVDFVSLSLDGSTPEKNAGLRGGNTSDFGRVVRIVNKIRGLEKRPRCQIVTLVHRNNASDIEAIGSFLQREFAQMDGLRWKLNYYVTISRSSDGMSMPYEEFEALAGRMQKRFPSLGVGHSPLMHSYRCLLLGRDGDLMTMVDEQYTLIGNLLTGEFAESSEEMFRRVLDASRKKMEAIGRGDMAEKLKREEEPRASSSGEVARRLKEDFDALMEGADEYRIQHARLAIESFEHFIRGRNGFQFLYDNITSPAVKARTPDKDGYFDALDKVFEIYNGLSAEDKEALLLAVILHDIGFAKTKNVWDHWAAGAHAAIGILREYGVTDENLVTNAAYLVFKHGKMTDIGVDSFPADFCISRNWKAQLLVMDLIDCVSKLERRASPPYGADNIASTQLIEEMLNQYKMMDTMSAAELLYQRLRIGCVPLSFNLSREGLEFSNDEFEYLIGMARHDPTFSYVWSRNIRVNIFPLFLLARREGEGLSRVERLYKLMRLVAYIVDAYIEKTGDENILILDVDGDDFTDAVFERILAGLADYFRMPLEEITENSVKEALDDDDWESAFGLRLRFEGNKMLIEAPPAGRASTGPISRASSSGIFDELPDLLDRWADALSSIRTDRRGFFGTSFKSAVTLVAAIGWAGVFSKGVKAQEAGERTIQIPLDASWKVETYEDSQAITGTYLDAARGLRVIQVNLVAGDPQRSKGELYISLKGFDIEGITRDEEDRADLGGHKVRFEIKTLRKLVGPGYAPNGVQIFEKSQDENGEWHSRYSRWINIKPGDWMRVEYDPEREAASYRDTGFDARQVVTLGLKIATNDMAPFQAAYAGDVYIRNVAIVPPARESSSGDFADTDIDFGAIESSLFPRLTEDEERHIKDMLADLDTTADRVPHALSGREEMVWEETKYDGTFTIYKEAYYLARDRFLETLGRYRDILGKPASLKTEEGKRRLLQDIREASALKDALTDRKEDLVRAITDIVLFNMMFLRPRHWLRMNMGRIEMADDVTSRRFSMTPSSIYQMLQLADIRPGDIILDPFAGAGNLLAYLSAYREAERIIAGDIIYGMPEEGREAYAIEDNLRALDGLFDFLPPALRPQFKRVDILQHDATALPIADGAIDKIVTDPSYGRESKGEGPYSTEPEAFLAFLRGVKESHRVLKPSGRALFIVPSEWAVFLKGLARSDLSAEGPEDLYGRFYELTRGSPYYEKTKRPYPYKYSPEDWQEAKDIMKGIVADEGAFGFYAQEVEPTYFFPMSIMVFSKPEAAHPEGVWPLLPPGRARSERGLLELTRDERLEMIPVYKRAKPGELFLKARQEGIRGSRINRRRDRTCKVK